MRKHPNNLEIHVQFSKVSQWLDYAEVKHLKLLEDYAQEQGLSWLARPPKSPPGDASVVVSKAKSIDTARAHIKKARGSPYY